jgi:hypothetical protein
MKSKSIFILFLICSLHFLNVHSQEKNDSNAVKFVIDNVTQLFYQYNKSTGVHIDNVSNIWGSRVFPQSNMVTDNPLFHGAFYSLIKSETSVHSKYKLDLDLLLEHRGMSYGLYDMNNVVIFPYYKFIIPENVNLLGDSLNILLHFGSFMQGKIHEGLKIYNIDYHGFICKLDWRRFFFQYYQIGDLSWGIGLRLEELYDYSIGYNIIEESERKLKFGLNLSINNYAAQNIDSLLFKHLDLAQNDFRSYYYSNYGIWGEYTFLNKAGIYFQYEIRNTPYINIAENSAILIGGNIKLNYSKLCFTINPELRYYGWMYNFAHKDDSVSYRKKSSGVDKYSSNTVGRYLYPLMNYNNNFSQWAVYTDYQYQNIAGLEMRVNLKRQLYKSIDVDLESESCTLIKEYNYKGKKTFTYLFYSAQLVYNAAGLFKIGIGISNKSMNLDKHYNTFYVRKIPAIHFYIRKELIKK